MDAQLSTKDVLNILTNNYSNADRQRLFELEKLNKIPVASRKTVGKIDQRVWSLNDLPKLAQYFGFLQKPKSQLVLSIYAPKGGVWKTTFSNNLARILAIHGIKTIIIGLDSQVSITSLCEQDKEITDLSQYEACEEYTLFNFLELNHPIGSIIKKTDLEYLDYIPEGDDLDRLALSLVTKNRGEYQIKEKLLPLLKNYDVIIFDNPPAYSKLSVSSMIACDVMITPLGCEIEAFKAVDRTMDKLFKSLIEDYKLNFKQIYVPTKLDNTTLSKQIQYEYQNKFKGEVVLNPLRSSIVGQEASFNKKSVFEYKANSPLANDYFTVIKEVWQKVLA